jgi:hypothetical protein
MTQINGQLVGTSNNGSGNITIGINTTGYGTYTSGGYIGFIGSQNWFNQFSLATKQAVETGELTRELYQGFVSRSGVFPSNYQYIGTDAWGAIDTEYDSSAIMDAITTYNTTLRPYRFRLNT